MPAAAAAAPLLTLTCCFMLPPPQRYEDYERVLVRMERLFQLETGAMGFVVRHTRWGVS